MHMKLLIIGLIWGLVFTISGLVLEFAVSGNLGQEVENDRVE